MASDLAGTALQSEARPRSFLARHSRKLALSAVITLGLWYTLHKGGLKIVPESGDFGHVRWWTLPIYLVTLLGMTWFRSVRWRFLLRSMAPVGRKRLFAVSCIGFAAIMLLPFRIGELVRPYLVRTPPGERGGGIDPGAGTTGRTSLRPITLTAATSSIIAERIIDGFYLSIVLAIALIFVPHVDPLPDRVVGLPVSVQHVRSAGFVMLGLFAALFASVAVFYFARSWAHAATFAILDKVSSRLANRLAGMFEKVADGLHVLSRGQDALGFLFETSLYWGLNVTGMWFLAWGCGVTHADGSLPTFGEACALMGMLGCAILIPGPPGMLGVFQAGLYAAMTMYYPTGVVTGSGAAYVFVMYAVQIVFTIACGTAGLLYEQGEQAGALRELEETI